MIAWLMIILAGMAIFWRILETGGTQPILFILAFELVFGVAAASMMGARTPFNDQVTMKEEIDGVTLGIFGGLLLIVIQVVIMVGSSQFSATTIYHEATLLAPIPEELFFTFVIYGTFRRIAPDLNWIFSAIPASVIFAGYHFFVIGTAVPYVLILFFGSIVIKYVFEVTSNIAAAMIAHEINNSLVELSFISEMISQYWMILAFPIILFSVWLILFGGRRK